MSQLRHIKKRIFIIKNIQKTTRAMKMIAASKLRRAQVNLLTTREYFNQNELILNNVFSILDKNNPLISPREETNKALLIGISADRGLCGSFNTNIINAMENFYDKFSETSSILLGRKCIDYFKKRKSNIIYSNKIDKFVNHANLFELSNMVIKNYLGKPEMHVYLLYTEFKTMLVQRVILKKLLPIEMPKDKEALIPPIIEPDIKTVTDKLLAQTISTKIKLALVESIMSEFASRMNAMESATTNASDLISRLTLEYNRARQASITKEMIEITVGKESLA
jgi:F-type H+-transporting ATPase subunit gamma